MAKKPVADPPKHPNPPPPHPADSDPESDAEIEALEAELAAGAPVDEEPVEATGGVAEMPVADEQPVAAEPEYDPNDYDPKNDLAKDPDDPTILLEGGGRLQVQPGQYMAYRVVARNGRSYDHCHDSPRGEWVYRPV